jgi:hypothetical protein
MSILLTRVFTCSVIVPCTALGCLAISICSDTAWLSRAWVCVAYSFFCPAVRRMVGPNHMLQRCGHAALTKF